MGFLICKSKISVVKNILSTLVEIILTCSQKSIFNEKSYLRSISSKYPVPAKRDKFPHVINLWIPGVEKLIHPIWNAFLGVIAWKFSRNLTSFTFM